MKTTQLFSSACLLRAGVLVLGFLYTLFFTSAYSTAHVMSLTDAILRSVFLPQALAALVLVDMLPSGLPLWVTIIPAIIPAFMVSVIEARLSLALANVTGKIPLIGWMGHQNQNSSNCEPFAPADAENPRR